MHAQSRRDWAAFAPAAIPTKTQVPHLDRWLDTLSERPAHSVDIGCGAGGGVRRLLARGFSVVGIDINPAAIAELQHELPLGDRARVQLHERDVASPAGFALGTERFDVAVCQLVASVVGDAQDRATLLRNTHDVLRPGGSLFISFSGWSGDVNAEYADLYAHDAQATGEPGSYYSRDASGRVLYRTHHFTPDEIEHLLRDHGFRAICITEQLESSSRRPDQRARFFYVTCQRA